MKILFQLSATSPPVSSNPLYHLPDLLPVQVWTYLKGGGGTEGWGWGAKPSFMINSIKLILCIPWAGNPYWRGRISAAILLVKIACLVKKNKNSCQSNWPELLSQLYWAFLFSKDSLLWVESFLLWAFSLLVTYEWPNKLGCCIKLGWKNLPGTKNLSYRAH